MTDRFFLRPEPVRTPEDVIPLLAKGSDHWKQGRSAYELAHSWLESRGIPTSVQEVLGQSDTFRGAQLVEGFFEHNTSLRTAGRDSQTDLLAVVRMSSGLGIIGVEGKVDESFGPLVRDWNDGSIGKTRRLASLLKTLNIDLGSALDLRYQLFHRTAAAVYESQRYGAGQAMMLVHSFSPNFAGFDDFAKFAEVLGTPVREPNSVSVEIALDGIAVSLSWVADRPGELRS